MDFYTVSTFWLLWTLLQWTWVCEDLFEILISVLLDKYLEVGLLDHMLVLVLISWGPSYYFPLYLSVQFSHSVMSNSLRPHESQHARPPCPSPAPGVHSNSRPLSRWCHPVISSSGVPFSSCPNPSQHQSLFQWVNTLHEVAKVLEFQLQHHCFLRTPRADLPENELVGSPCSPRDSQESSPTPQFKSINSSALSFFHSPTLTSIHDHWKNHSLD